MSSNGVITSDWEFTEKAHIELPISCSIESDQIKCGALKLTSNKVVTVEVGPTRMMKIVKQTVGEEKVKITGKVFRGNFTKFNSFVSPPSTTLGLSTFYWVLIGSVSGSLILIATISGICGYKIHSGRNASESPRKTAGGNTFIKNDIQISNPESKFWFSSTRRKKNNAMILEEYPVQSTRVETKFKELERVLTPGGEGIGLNYSSQLQSNFCKLSHRAREQSIQVVISNNKAFGQYARKPVFYYNSFCTQNGGMGTLGENEVNPGYIFKKLVLKISRKSPSTKSKKKSGIL